MNRDARSRRRVVDGVAGEFVDDEGEFLFVSHDRAFGAAAEAKPDMTSCGMLVQGQEDLLHTLAHIKAAGGKTGEAEVEVADMENAVEHRAESVAAAGDEGDVPL